MGVFFPQGVMTLRVVLENNGDESIENLNKVHTFTVLCKNLKVNLNSYREADTFDVTLDYKSFPFDPRTIRSAGVTIHVEDKGRLFDQNNQAQFIEPSEQNTIFQGFVDEDKIDLNDDNRTVNLSGRDFTSLLIDREYIGPPIQLTSPLDVIFRELLDQSPATRLNGRNGIRINNQTGGPLPIIANFGASREADSTVKNPKRGRSYWDHIQDMTAQAGLISYISLDELIITRPRTLYNRDQSKLFVYGQNLTNLSFERKLGRQKNFNVRVISYDIEKKNLIEARIPENASANWARDIGINRKRIQVPTLNTKGEKGEPQDAPFITFRIRDVSNYDQLVEVGQGIFEETGRQQIEGRLTTKEMQVCDVNNNFFDATSFRVGVPIELLIDAGDLQGLPELTEGNQAVNRNRIRQFLITRCYDPQIAEALAESLTRFDTPFYTKEVEFTLDQENGFSMEINFINFITLTSDLVQ